MKHLKLFLIFLLGLISIPASSQEADYLIEVSAGKKILRADNLDLPPTTPVSEILSIFPELLAREGDVTLSNYDVQVNDVSMGACKENVLVQYKLCDIKTIEVSQTPSTSQQKNGQGGVIKLKLKDIEDGFSGNASVYVNSIFRAQPGVMVGYQKNKWTIRSSFLMEYYQPRNEITARETIYPKKYTYDTDTSYIRQGYEMLSFDAMYQPDKQKKLHIWATECLGLQKNEIFGATETNSVVKNTLNEEFERNFKYLLGANWQQEFGKSKLELEFTLDGSPFNYYKYKYDADTPGMLRIWQYDAQQQDNIFKGLVKYIYHFVPVKPHNKADLTAGVNCSNEPIGYWHDYSYRPANDYQGDIPQYETLSSKNNILYLSPYVESNNEFGKFFLKAGLRYQHYFTQIDVRNENNFEMPENYFTAFLNFGYQVAPHHHLSLILDRSVNRMDPYMLYPYTVFSPSLNYFTKGNPALKPVSVHNVSLNYITDFAIDDKYFTFDAELKYINSDKLITSNKGEEAITYKNDGQSNIFAANILFHFSYEVFTLNLTSNFFSNRNDIGGVPDKYNYFNISLLPALNFGNNWSASIRFTYNSHIYTNRTRLSDYFYTITSFSKSWDNITAYLQLSDNFHKNAQDIIYGDALSETYYYNLHRPGLELGFHIKF